MTDEKRLDETVPGGRYQVGGEWVNAFGEPVEAPTKRKSAQPAPPKDDTKDDAPSDDKKPE